MNHQIRRCGVSCPKCNTQCGGVEGHSGKHQCSNCHIKYYKGKVYEN